MRVVVAIATVTASIIIVICTYWFWRWPVKEKGNMAALLLVYQHIIFCYNDDPYTFSITRRKQETELLLYEKWEEYFENLAAKNKPQEKMNQIKFELLLLCYKKVANATNNFNLDNKLGQDGFGPVYKERISDKQEIAVKRLSRSSGQGLEVFMSEILVVSKLQHCNLVMLLGCCIEGDEEMLIYEYMPNSSKQEHLDWRKRANIIQGIGRGLLYLHRDSKLRIIHRDLKESNILLDGELNPTISDFVMARTFGGNQDHENTRRVVGT